MKRSKAMMMLIALNVLLPIVVLADDGKTLAADTVKVSRWGRVDLTQYCGRTVGELLDALGNDYNDFLFIEEPPEILNSCMFLYDDGQISMRPNTFKYCHLDTSKGPWNIIEYRKEKADYIEMEFRLSKDGPRPMGDTEVDRNKGFALDYPKYMGRAIGLLVKEISYPCEFSKAVAHGGGYTYCRLEYPNGVTIGTEFGESAPVPAEVTDTEMVNDYVLQQNIGILFVKIRCLKGADAFGDTNTYRIPDKKECRTDVSGAKGSDVSAKWQDKKENNDKIGDMKNVIKRHMDEINKLIQRVKEYNNTYGAFSVGTLVIVQTPESGDPLGYIMDIGGKDDEAGINPNRYNRTWNVVATVHTHDDCAEPSPADVQAFARGQFGSLATIIGTNDNSLSIMQYSGVKTARSFAISNSRAAIADKCRDLLNPTPSCDRRLELIRRFFDMENTGIDYMHVTDWREWIK